MIKDVIKISSDPVKPILFDGISCCGAAGASRLLQAGPADYGEDEELTQGSATHRRQSPARDKAL